VPWLDWPGMANEELDAMGDKADAMVAEITPRRARGRFGGQEFSRRMADAPWVLSSMSSVSLLRSERMAVLTSHWLWTGPCFLSLRYIWVGSNVPTDAR